MKNKKLWITASFICILAGAILTIAGRLMGGRPGFYIDARGVHAAGSSNHPDPAECSMVLDEFDSMEIHADYADIELIPSDEFSIEYRLIGSLGTPVCEVRNGKLTFQEAERFSAFNIGFFTMDPAVSEPDYFIRVKIPKDTKLSDAVFDIESGNLDISSIQADTLKIKDEYGDVTLGRYQGKRLDVIMESGVLSLGTVNTAQADLSNEYGSILISEASGGSLSVQMESCDLKIGTVDFPDVNITDDYGTVNIDEASGDSLTVQMESCDCQIDRMDFSDTEITNSYGDIRLGLPGKIEHYGFNLISEYGDIRIGDKTLTDDSEGSDVIYKAAGNGQKTVAVSCESGNINIQSVK